jgi:hypothetical protein
MACNARLVEVLTAHASKIAVFVLRWYALKALWRDEHEAVITPLNSQDPRLSSSPFRTHPRMAAVSKCAVGR